MPQDQPHRAKILVVDDEVSIANTVCMIFEHFGYDCRKAFDAEMALMLALQSQPDFLLSDVVLPGMSGVQLAMTFRDRMPECKILLFSGQASTSQLLEEAKEKGYDFEILAKPVHPKVLIDYVKKILAEPSRT